MYLSGRQESRKVVWATALLPKSNHSVGGDGTFLPEEEDRWHELQGGPPGRESAHQNVGYQCSFDAAMEFLK